MEEPITQERPRPGTSLRVPGIEAPTTDLTELANPFSYNNLILRHGCRGGNPNFVPGACMAVPVVAIVGRPNVGKSSLFNWLAGKRIAIVDPTAGVTRDRVSTLVRAEDSRGNERYFELVDTGGIGVQDVDNLTASGTADSARHQRVPRFLVTDSRSGPAAR